MANRVRSLIIVSAFMVLFLSSCTKEIAEDVAACDIMPEYNSEHPKAVALQSILDDYVQAGLPGLSMVVETPVDGLWLGTAGKASLEDQVAMEPCHLHHSASIAKTFIATLILQLAEKEQLGLDEQARDYLPEEVFSNIENAEQATIRQLLNHTSGIYNFDDNLKAYVDTFNDPLVNPSTLAFFEKYVYGVPAYFEVGEGHHYSNTNYSLLGMIIENITGIPLGEYMKQSIFDPLGLEHTYFNSPAGSQDEENVVNSYFEHFSKQLQNGTDIQKHFTNIAKGHEGVISTPYEFAQFMKLLVTGKVLSAEYTALMMDIEQAYERGRYRLGIIEYETIHENGFGHTGGSIGTMSYAIYFPESEVSFSICCNLGTVFASENTKMFYDDLFQDLLSEIFD
jgi:D-alanyl-D-alanine carboxypeptidase